MYDIIHCMLETVPRRHAPQKIKAVGMESGLELRGPR